MFAGCMHVLYVILYEEFDILERSSETNFL